MVAERRRSLRGWRVVPAIRRERKRKWKRSEVNQPRASISNRIESDRNQSTTPAGSGRSVGVVVPMLHMKDSFLLPAVPILLVSGSLFFFFPLE